jgi:hypothetical protein
MDFPSGPRRSALALAMVADALQIFLFPLLGEGALSPLNDALDVVIAYLLTRLLGWHWAFLPSFVIELVPGLDLAPTWTLAVLIVTRGMTTRAPVPAALGEPPTIEGKL